MNQTVEFIYDRMVRRPRRLKNNVFVLYSPKRIQIQPGEKINIDMKLKIRMQKNIVGSCTLLQTFDENGIKLLNSQHIYQKQTLPLIKIILIMISKETTYHCPGS